MVKRKDVVVLRDKIANYAFIDKKDDNDKYRVSVELTKEDIYSLTEAVKAANLEEYLPLDVEEGDMLAPKTAFEPKIGYTNGAEIKDIYSGCKVHILVSPFEYTYKKKKGVSFGLQGVVKCGEGERLDGGIELSDYIDVESDLPF